MGKQPIAACFDNNLGNVGPYRLPVERVFNYAIFYLLSLTSPKNNLRRSSNSFVSEVASYELMTI